ncbi:hypothetical protein C1645_804478 [Glomus cerebriforme]|uniref:Uncharacterized protein n=1 Tax=Glomus cerebriforme TaxID=658196 RepID=A0A397T3H2_9GLOM|nr:hypothetical protein C1645_804478 [Glomus cerebriforme]
MNNENEQYKKWFKRLFQAFHHYETAIEFQNNDSPPTEFLKIINSETPSIKVLLNDSTTIWYWFKEDEPEIINQAIKYIDTYFCIDDKIKSKDLDERKKLEKKPEDDDKVMEWEMQKKIINNLDKSESIFPGFFYLFKYEWVPIGSDGENDLILTDGKGIFAIVETKRIKDVKAEDIKKYKLSYVIHQSGYYKQEFIKSINKDQVYKDKDYSFDVIAVIGVGITDEDDTRIFFGTFDEQVCSVYDKRLMSYYQPKLAAQNIK